MGSIAGVCMQQSKTPDEHFNANKVFNRALGMQQNEKRNPISKGATLYPKKLLHDLKFSIVQTECTPQCHCPQHSCLLALSDGKKKTCAKNPQDGFGLRTSVAFYLPMNKAHETDDDNGTNDIDQAL